ncbi:hypothetical protein L1887_47857 [Cichorium endivia]|nr:hypothetical protein L1887_47857 [Cichorium endivia]
MQEGERWRRGGELGSRAWLCMVGQGGQRLAGARLSSSKQRGHGSRKGGQEHAPALKTMKGGGQGRGGGLARLMCEVREGGPLGKAPRPLGSRCGPSTDVLAEESLCTEAGGARLSQTSQEQEHPEQGQEQEQRG